MSRWADEKKASTKFEDNALWRVTDGAEEHQRRMAEEEARENEIVRGLAKCAICGGEAKAVGFGLGHHGLWIGCDRSEGCSRHIEIHLEGWSLEEVAADWNRRNRGWRKWVRKFKHCVWKMFDEGRRYERKVAREKKRAEREEKERMREIFGIKKSKKGWRLLKILRIGNKKG